MSYSRPTSVTRTLPVTVAVTVFSAAFGPYRLVYACAADHGGSVAPHCDATNARSPVSAAGSSGATGSTAGAASAPASASRSGLSSAGSSSQPSCSSTLYALTRGTVRQLSIEPVGHGGTQAMHRLHFCASTT